MTINNIPTNASIKIGKTSITVKDENGKTCGIVRNIQTWETLSPNQQFNYFPIIAKAGLWGNTQINGLMKNIVIDGKQIYLFVNRKVIEYFEKNYQQGNDYLKEEADRKGKAYANIFLKCAENNITVVYRYFV